MKGSGEGLAGHPELSHVHRCPSACPKGCMILGVTEAQGQGRGWRQVWDNDVERDDT